MKEGRERGEKEEGGLRLGRGGGRRGRGKKWEMEVKREEGIRVGKGAG